MSSATLEAQTQPAVIDASAIGVALIPLGPGMPRFVETMRKGEVAVRRRSVSTVQINIGYKCDLACSHCHVESGPKRTEAMDRATCERILDLIDASSKVEILDITGGAPELNPNFRFIASQARQRGLRVFDRCNLTVLFEPGQEDTAEFLAEWQIEIVASLPCYTSDNVDSQRGKGVFDKSIKALQKLNRLGYGKPDSSLILNLVYNPVGAHLPGPQSQLKADYKKFLKKDFDIEFNDLYTITNMPIKRYERFLRNNGKFEEYMQLLIDNYNPRAAGEVMCTSMVSIGYDGRLYDCDFNQMLDLPHPVRRHRSIEDIESFDQIGKAIALDNHCYGCTAGAGSSCGGALLEEAAG